MPLGAELTVFDLAAVGTVGFLKWAALEALASACTSEIESAIHGVSRNLETECRPSRFEYEGCSVGKFADPATIAARARQRAGLFCPREVKFFCPLQAEANDLHSGTVLEERAQHIEAEGAHAFHDVAGFFDALVETDFIQEFKECALRRRHQRALGRLG